MSSSGVIYAIIVGAWAVYLVPMWLRREDELNRARETQRYAAAIKVLAHKEAFERRWARDAEAGADDVALPIAAGQGFVPTGTARSSAKKTAASAKPKTGATASASTPTAAKATKSTRQAVAATDTARTGAKSAVTATVAADRAATAAPVAASAPARTSAAPTKAQRPAITATLGGRTPSGSRVGLMARRRRVVAILFAAFTLGALISADLGARFVWVMVLPAALLSAYIVWLRRDERTQAANRDRRRASAQESHAQREARARANAKAIVKRQPEAKREARDNQQLAQALEERHELLNRLDAEAEAQAEAKAEAAAHASDQRRQAQAAARRRSTAAARARAQAFTQDAQDLPRASNG